MVVAVVAFEVAAMVAAFDVALPPTHCERGQRFGGDAPSEVTDREDVLAFPHNSGQERGSEEVFHPRHIDGSDTRDLTHFAVDGPTAHHCTVMNDDVHGVAGCLLRYDGGGGGVGVGVAEDELRDRVRGVRVERFMFSIGFGGPEDPLDLRVDRGFDRAADFRRPPVPAAEQAIAAGPHRPVPLAFVPCRPGVRIFDRGPRLNARVP